MPKSSLAGLMWPSADQLPPGADPNAYEIHGGIRYLRSTDPKRTPGMDVSVQIEATGIDPLSIRLSCDQDRHLASALLDLPDVVGVELQNGSGLLVRARNPRRFFQQLTALILEEDFDVQHLETLDDSTHAVLGYLLGKRAQ